jgi:TolB-like protein
MVLYLKRQVILRKTICAFMLFGTVAFLYAKGSPENLDKVIDTQGSYLLNTIPQNSIIAIIGISSGSEELSKYTTEGLTSYIMYNNKSNIRLVERDAMPILQKEIDFQYSGAVNDDFMVSLGKTVGANTVVAGTIYSIGSGLRFNIRAIEIETSYVIAANGSDFEADKKVKSLLKGRTVEKTLSRDNIPVRQNDGSISKANQELMENQRQAIYNTAGFFLKDFFDREPRVLVGYNYFPDFPLAFELGYLKNGFGGYVGMGVPLRDNNYSFSYIGETVGVINFYFGLTYPLFFNWLWVGGGTEMYVVDIADRKDDVSEEKYWSEQELGFNPSIGIYLSFKRLYITAKYRYLFYGNSHNSFMLGIGVGL